MTTTSTPALPTRLRLLLIAALTPLLAIPIAAVPAHAAAPSGVTGAGTAADPFALDTADDLRAMISAINSDQAAYGATSIRLTADLSLAGGDPLTPIDTFTGSIDGMGHTISDLSYASGAGGHRGLIRQLTGGKVVNLTLKNLNVDNGTSAGFVAGIAVYAQNATLSGDAVVNSTLTASSAEKVGGLIAESDSSTMVDNYVDAKITANEMPAGIAAYAKNASVISRNLVRADLTMLTGGGDSGTKGNDAAMIVGYPGNPNTGVFSKNVALGGTIAYTGKVDGFVGRIAGYTAYDGWSATDNLANSEITINGKTVAGPGTKNQHGTDATAASLAQQGTYSALGWDFTDAWAFDSQLGHPVPRYVYSLAGNGSAEMPFQLATPLDLEFLAQQLNAGVVRYTAAANYVLTNDLDFTGRPGFVGIDIFAATLDGQGHAIKNISYVPNGTNQRLGLIRTANGASIRNLRVVSPTAVSGSTTAADFVSGLVVVATTSTISKVSVIGMNLSAPGVEKVAGLVDEMSGGAVTNSWADGTVKALKMPSGLVSYVKNAGVISNNLVSAELEAVTSGGTNGTRGIDAGAVLTYPGSNNGSTVQGNVVFSGKITYTGKVDGFAGRVVGYSQASGNYALATLKDNLANSAVTVAGNTVTGTATNQNGADTLADDLAKQATYEAIGWDFETGWTFDATLAHPVPKVIQQTDRPNRITTTINGDPRSRRGFTWYSTLSSRNAVVQLSTDRALAAPTAVPAVRKISPTLGTFYQAVATGLTPGTRYYYRVGDSAAPTWSSIGTFVTSDGSSEFSFVDLTDTQSQTPAEAELSASTIAKSLATVPSAAFVMVNGDVVEHGGLESDWSDLLDAARSSLLNTSLAPAAGNHDQAPGAFVNHFALDAPNHQNTDSGDYYSFDYNMAHFVVLNTNEHATQNLSTAQLDWIRSDVTAARANGAKWVIVNMHKGAYTTANHSTDADVIAMRKVFVPLMDDLDVDLVLQGHDHVMSRSKPLVYDANAETSAKAVKTTVITELLNGKRTEYAVKPDGTIYFLPNTAGAKHYTQKASTSAFDLEKYLQLFDRTGEQATENFVGIRVSDQRLTVNVYDIRDKGLPRLFDSFGIDRQVPVVDAQIDALPAADALTAADANAVAAARAAVDALSRAEQDALTNLKSLRARERRLQELAGAVTDDGSRVAWAAPDAASRQPIVVRNDTRSRFTGVPVKLTIPDSPDVTADKLAFFTTDGTPLPYEAESWQPSGKSVVWVRVPSLRPATGTTVWAYFGTSKGVRAPARVWGEDYSLVEHFASPAAKDATITDSTGTRKGRVVAGDLAATVDANGDGVADLGNTRLQYDGTLGGDYDRIAISSVASLSAAELATMTTNAPILAKESKTGDGQLTFWQGITPAGKLSTRLAGNSFEFGNVDLVNNFDFPVDGKLHLITQTYDGMTYSVFLDGLEVLAQMVEYRSTYGDQAVPATIGDYFTNTGALAAPFPGSVAEAQLAGVAFTPDYEAFRYADYFGTAVSFGARTTKADDALSLSVTSPAEGGSLEAGLTPVSGTLSARAELSASVGGTEVFRKSLDAGDFTVSMPINALGNATLALTATAGGKRAQASVALTVTDTSAPSRPKVSDTSATAKDADVTLTATPQTDDLEKVTTRFFANASVPLTTENTVVRTGTTAERTPARLTPSSGTVSAELLPTTTGENLNPYQLYTVTLTPEQAAKDQFHLTWSGKAGSRRVSALLWDNTAKAWIVAASGSSTSGGQVDLDVTAKAGQNVVSPERTLTMLIWRGLTALPYGAADYSSQPARADIDWSFDHVPDTQLYSQATPSMLVDQFAYLRDRAKSRNTQLVVQSGDWVNREYLSQEYQWKNAEPAMQQLADAKIPFMVSWGNHDYSDARNGRLMLQKYFPMSRYQDGLDGSPWTFGGNNGIDDYYYLGELGGAKVLVLSVGFFSADNSGDAGLSWAAGVIANHPDYAVIIASHNSVGAGQNSWSNSNITSRLVDPYRNVKLVLGGHIAGTGVASRTRSDGSVAYGILTDYQSRVYGGQEYLRHLSVDSENGLLYANIYSPYLRKPVSEGSWHQAISESAVPGFHGSDSENFVIDLNLGGTTTRTLQTGSVGLAAGAATQVGPDQDVTGSAPARAVLSGSTPGTTYEWYAELTDPAGNLTRSATSRFTIATPLAPSVPRTVSAAVSGTSVQASWLAPSSDGGAVVDQYEVKLSTGVVQAVTGTSATFEKLADGQYSVSVRAHNAAGWSAWSEASAQVEVKSAAAVTAPSVPTQVAAKADGASVQASWVAPSSDGGAVVDQYEVKLSTGVVQAVTGTSATFEKLADGQYAVSVRAHNAAGWSVWSEASAQVEVKTAVPPTPGTPAIAVSGALRPSGVVSVQATGLAAGTSYELQLGSTQARLASGVADREGMLTLRATIPAKAKIGLDRLVLSAGGREIAHASVRIEAAPPLRSSVTVKVSIAKKGLHKGRKATVKVVVAGPKAVKATGRVRVQLLSTRRTVTLKKGAASVTLPKFGRTGRYTVTVAYQGSSTLLSRTVTVKVKVTR